MIVMKQKCKSRCTHWTCDSSREQEIQLKDCVCQFFYLCILRMHSRVYVLHSPSHSSYQLLFLATKTFNVSVEDVGSPLVSPTSRGIVRPRTTTVPRRPPCITYGLAQLSDWRQS
jgi:hypothetical protein